MSRKKLIYVIIGAVALTIILISIVALTGKKDEPVQREDDNQSQSPSEKLKSDMKKYRGDKTVSNSKTNDEKANKEHLYLNADNKVLVATDSNSSEEVKESMLKWNNALGENVFLPAKENGRTDLLVQDDETQIPVNIFGGEDTDDTVPSEYKERVIPTQDHRLMILDKAKQRYEEEFDYLVEDEISQRLGESIGIKGDVETIKSKLATDDGKNELKKKFKDVKSNGLYNDGLEKNSKEVKTMDNPYNKTYATLTNYKDNLENLPRLNGHNHDLLTVINAKKDVLYGDEAVKQGKTINAIFQETLKSIQRGGTSSASESEYYDNSDKHDGTKTVAGTNSKMGDDEDFVSMSSSYRGGE